MNRVKEVVVNEPVVITGAVEAVLLVFLAFGLDLTGEQVAYVMGAVTAVLTLAARALVTPVSGVALTKSEAEALAEAGF